MRRVLSNVDIWKLVGWFLFVMTASIVASFFISGTGLALFVVLLLIVCLFVYKPMWGVYAFAFVAPMSELMIDFSKNETLSRIPYAGSVYAPFVDFVALSVLLVCGVLVVLRPRVLRWRALVPYGWLFVLWLVAVGASVYFARSEFLSISVKAFARPYAFTFVAFVVPVLLLVRSRGDIVRALIAYELACVLGAIMGFVSIFIVPLVGFPRAVPFDIFGLQPFGTNHNVLAEALTAIIPFSFYWAYECRGRARVYATIAALLITGASLATFSRAAWIVVALQVVIFLMVRMQDRKKLFIGMAGAAALASIFFVWIQSTDIAASSDATRIDLLGIGLTYFQRAPWIGQGPGTFVPLVAGTAIFQMQYGDPLDAHGVFEKMLPETGIIGTAAFAVLIIVIMWQLWRRRRDSFEFMLFVTVVSIWLYQLFNTGYFAAKVWVLMALALASLTL